LICEFIKKFRIAKLLNLLQKKNYTNPLFNTWQHLIRDNYKILYLYVKKALFTTVLNPSQAIKKQTYKAGNTSFVNKITNHLKKVIFN